MSDISTALASMGYVGTTGSTPYRTFGADSAASEISEAVPCLAIANDLADGGYKAENHSMWRHAA